MILSTNDYVWILDDKCIGMHNLAMYVPLGVHMGVKGARCEPASYVQKSSLALNLEKEIN